MKDLRKCSECGYDLRGHVGVGRCPECGAAFDGAPPEPMWTLQRKAAVYVMLIALGGLALLNWLTAGPPAMTSVLPHTVAEQFIALWLGAAAVCAIATIASAFARPPRGMVVLAMGIGAAVSIIMAFLNYILWVIILMSV